VMSGARCVQAQEARLMMAQRASITTPLTMVPIFIRAFRRFIRYPILFKTMMFDAAAPRTIFFRRFDAAVF